MGGSRLPLSGVHGGETPGKRDRDGVTQKGCARWPFRLACPPALFCNLGVLESENQMRRKG